MDLNHKRIAVLGLKRIGDAVYTLQTFEAIKRVYPTAKIMVFTEPQVEAIYQHNPFIDEVQSYSKKRFWQSTFKVLKEGLFDACIINHNAFKYALLPFLAGIPVRVGYQKEGRSVLLTHKRPLHETVVHRLEHNALLLDLLSIESRDLLPRIYEGSEEMGLSGELLSKFGLVDRGYVVFIVGSIAETRRWFPENFAELARKIESELKLKIVILGGPDDQGIAQKVLELYPEDKNNIQSLAGKTSLRETILLLKHAKIVATNDTGPLHVSSALGIPVVTWFGAADEQEIKPPSPNTTVLNTHVHCSPCVKEVCPEKTLACLVQITPAMVYKELLNKVKPPK